MVAIVNPSYIYGNLNAPPSKSYTQRAFAGALLHKNRTTIQNYGSSADEVAALQIVQQLGINIISKNNDSLVCNSNFLNKIPSEINCGESGLASRLFAPIAALASVPILISGSGSLLKRHMWEINDVFTTLNVKLPYFNGFIPYTLCGPLQSKNLTISNPESSQFISGLLIALSYTTKEKLIISIENLKSKPYIDLTLDILQHFGKPITHYNYQEFHIDPSFFQKKQNITITVEGDWSSASFFLVAGAIAGQMSVNNLNLNSTQADKAIIDVLEETGAIIIKEDNCITVKKNLLKPFEFDATHCPDLFPVLSILAACCRGESYIKGVHRLFNKESNRVESITEMLEAFGVHFSVEDDTLSISGQKKLQGTVIDSYNDHRIVMAAAIGALKTGSRVDILQAEAINKSYPNFFNDLKKCNIEVEIML